MDKKLEKIIKENFCLKDEKIEESWTSDNIPAWDSMGHLNLVVAIEKEFNIKFEIEEMFQMKSLGDLNELLKKKAVYDKAEDPAKELKECPICHDNNLRVLFQIEKFPYIGFSVSEKEKQKILERYSIKDLISSFKIVNCSNCSHIFQASKPDEKIMNTIYSDVYNYPSPMLSGFAQEREKVFLETFFKEILPICEERKLNSILEIACFDGFILQKLSQKGFQVSGCDPSKGADIAKRFGLNVYKQYFNSRDFIKRNEYFDIIIFRHFIEHVDDPIKLLKEVEKILTKSGLIIFETPNIEYYLENGSFESFNFQHLQNFSLFSANEVLKRAGLKLLKYKLAPQNLIVVAAREGEICPAENKMATELTASFAHNFRENVERLKLYLDPFLVQNKKIALWGAGGFCGLFFALYGVKEEAISYVVDIDERKWDMCFLDKDLKIYSPEKLLHDNVDLVIITSMYSREILKQLDEMKVKANVINLHPKVEYIKNRITT